MTQGWASRQICWVIEPRSWRFDRMNNEVWLTRWNSAEIDTKFHFPHPWPGWRDQHTDLDFCSLVNKDAIASYVCLQSQWLRCRPLNPLQSCDLEKVTIFSDLNSLIYKIENKTMFPSLFEDGAGPSHDPSVGRSTSCWWEVCFKPVFLSSKITSHVQT